MIARSCFREQYCSSKLSHTGFLNTIRAEKLLANILIVDDTPDNLDLLSAILRKRGYNTRCVDGGREAIKIAKSGWAELILLDIQMPEMDGYQICDRLKADPQTEPIPVIFISALDELADKKKAFKVGGVDYITKPFTIGEVAIRVANQITIQSSKNRIVELNEQLEQKVRQRTAELEQRNHQLKQEIDRRQQAQDRLFEMSLKDSITGFGNRNYLLARLKKALKQANQQSDYFFALILLECDRFKKIKRTLSHLASNQLLMGVAQRINSCLPKSALLSRLEGEEFGIFLDNIHDSSEAIAIAQQIQERLIQPFLIEQHQISVSVNLGIAIGSSDYSQPDRLFNDADLAMQQAQKLPQGDRYQVFEPEMYIQLQEDTESANRELALKQAVKRQEFINYYLPISDFKTQRPVEIEALVRWHHPQEGIITPQDFIDSAEKQGLMNAIGNLVLRQGCHHLKYWQNKHHSYRNLGICINLSAKQLFYPSLIAKIDIILRKTKIPGHHLKFDLSEAVIIEQPQTTLEVMQQLKKRRVKLCLDNFGIGYSSLTCLHRFPFDEIKIDRWLIAQIGQQQPDLQQEASAALLLEQIITIAHQLKMRVTATGIENKYQLNFLKKLGCDRGQGYLISKLLDRDSVDLFLAQSDRVHANKLS